MQKAKNTSKRSRKKSLPKKNTTIMPWLARGLIVCGLLLLCFGMSWQITHAALKKQPVVALPVAVVAEMPTRISFPSLGINQPVSPAQLTNNQWVVSDTGASYLVESARPGTPGNIITYGHDTTPLFAKVHNIKVGDTIILQTPTAAYTYRIITTRIISPDDVSILAPTKTELLTFYTCTGIFDTKRFVVQAVRV